jgi:serine/threonine-protein kinase
MTLFGRYNLVRKLAQGGMAEVFLARVDGPKGFQKKCVVKRILPEYSSDARFVEMFLSEARIAAELNHPNIVQIFDFGEVDGTYFIAMEFIDGPNLRTLSGALRALEDPLSLSIAARIVSLAAEGLHFAHELRDEQRRPTNLVHRDISPDNLLTSRTGHIKVVDFGIAKGAHQPSLTRSGMVKGKLAYMAPEQLDSAPLDRRADIFALGVVLYELVTGVLPFENTSEMSIMRAILSPEPLLRAKTRRADLPEELDAIIARCLEKDREARYANCRELQQALELFIQNEGKAVGADDIAAAVTLAFGDEFEPSLPNPIPSDNFGMASTVQRPVLATRAEPADAPESMSRRVPPTQILKEEDHVEASPSPSSAPVPSLVAEVPSAGRRRPAVILGGALLFGVLVALGLAIGKAASREDEVAHQQALSATERALATGSSDMVGAGLERTSPGRAGALERRDSGATNPTDVAAPVGDTVAVGGGVPAGGAVAVGGGVPTGSAVRGGIAAPAGSAVPGGAAAGDASPVSEFDGGSGRGVGMRVGMLAIRVRPYARVFIDGRLIGDTPIPPQRLSIGKHKIQLVNPTLQKDVTLEFNVKAGPNLLKHDLRE